MILLWAGAALAASCCASAGSQPTVLDRCDALGVAFALDAALDYGGWGWDGVWAGAGDDGSGSATASGAVLGRLTPWLQGGVRVPLRLAVERLDGAATAELGLGNALLWLDAEAPARRADTPRVALQVGLGTASSTAADATVAQAALRAAHSAGRWSVRGTVGGRVPITGVGAPDGEASIVVDHAAGERARLGLGVSGTGTGGPARGGALLLGPSLLLAPTRTDRIVLGVQAALPVDHLGRNAASRVLVSAEAFRVLAASPAPR